MTNENAGEPTEAVLAKARAAGFDVSENQLKRWHRDGLVPRPKQLWIDGVAGSQAIYPVGAGDQLCALCAIRASNCSSAKDWGWTLWWLGFPVAEKFWRRKLTAQAKLIDKSSTKFNHISDSDQPDDRYEELVATLRQTRTNNVAFRQLRRRLVAGHFEGMVGLMHSILAGEFRGWSFTPSDDVDSLTYRKMIERVFGFRRSKNNRDMIDNPSMHDDVQDALELLSNQLGKEKLTKSLMASSAAFIAETRIQLRVLLFTVSGLEERSTALAGLGLGVLKVIASRMRPADQAVLLLYLLALKRNSAFQKNLAVFLHALRRHIPKTISKMQIDYLRSHDPAVCSFAFPN